MSPRPIEEPDENENEPDENEPDENSPKTPPASSTTGKGHHHSTPTSNPTNDLPSLTSSPSSSSNSSVPPSTLGPVIVAIVVILVIITCCILHCARIRRRMNDEQRTQTINGWTSFLSQFRNKQATTAPPDVEGAVPVIAATDMKEKKNPRRKPLKKRDYYDRAFHYRMNKPPPLPPYEEEEQRGERQPSIVFSPGWLFAFSDKQNETESKNSQKHLINEMDGASAPLPPPPEPAHSATTEHGPERLCPHQVTVDDPVVSQKPNQKTLEP